MQITKKYSSIPHLIGSKLIDGQDIKMNVEQSKHFTERCLDKWVVSVEVKLDGSNCGIIRDGNRLHYVGRSELPV